jgi:ubiquinone/menaquinone biosynthesis C-methylase UbiE
MLARARKKMNDRGIGNVKFLQAPAERVPLDSDTFDAVTGCSFKPFTDMPAVMKEVHRVAKPGAIFSAVFPQGFSKPNDFVLEWFEPVLTVAPGPSRWGMLPDRGAAAIPKTVVL